MKNEIKMIIFEKVRFYSPLSREELVTKLATKVRPIPWIKFTGFGMPKHGKVFEGELAKDGFRLQRIINYKNSFLPKLNGKFVEKVNGTEIIVTIRPDMSVMIFLVLWFAFFGVGSFATLFNFSAETFRIDMLFPAMMILIGGGVAALITYGEKNIAKSALKKILEAEIMADKF